MTTLHIRQDALAEGHYPIRLTLKRPGQPEQEAEAKIQFALTEQEQEDLRWYLEDYLQRTEAVEAVAVQQVEAMMKSRGEELYEKVLAANRNTQALWFSVRNELADLRVEIAAGVAEAASIPWELMRDPEMDSPISLRVKSFVRVQSNPTISFVPVPPAPEGRVRLLYIACRPRGAKDVQLRAIANRLLQALRPDRARFDLKAIRPPTFEQLQKELADAKEAGEPYHILHFDGHGIYADLAETTLASWLSALSSVTLGGEETGKHGYLLFEHPGEDGVRPVDGQTLGQLLRDNGVPVLVLNACQSAMQQAQAAPKTAEGPHDQIRAVGSLAQAVIDQGIPAVLGMRYAVYVPTAAQYIGQLYAALAKGRGFGQAATEGRRHLQLNPDRWVGLRPRPLQDWFVPVVHEAAPIQLFPAEGPAEAGEQPELDPVQRDRALRRYVPEEGFIGRDETLLALDRAFDDHRVVLLHAYAGQGKSATAVEFARWYALTGGLGQTPLVFLASFEKHTDLNDLLNQIGQPLAPLLTNPTADWMAVNEPAQRLDVVKRILRKFPILWIWDNVELVAGFPQGTESQWTAAEQEELRDFLKQLKLDSATKVKVLLTSRRDEQKWLGGIPYRIPMPRMRNSDAANLALKLGQEKSLKPSEIAHWQPLLDYCVGNPLTLRVLVRQALQMGLRGQEAITAFVEAIRSGEQNIADADEKEGRDKSLGASLNYGFHHAFKDDELPIIALLHLFQATVDVDSLALVGEATDRPLPELKGRTNEQLSGLLERAAETGLLTHLRGTWFTIHPALPWFLRQLFARYYDGQDGRSTAQTATRAWVGAVGALGNYYHDQFIEGNRVVVGLLELEEANLLYARRLARRNQWWEPAARCMQGLRALYHYQGRTAEWARLVGEITPDVCASDDEPFPGREDEYAAIMDYRVSLARHHEHDLAKAGALQAKLVKFCRQQAAAALALGDQAPMDDDQRHALRSLAVSVEGLGQIEWEKDDPSCVERYREAIVYYRRIGDKRAEAGAEFNLGHAHMNVPAIRDLNAAEAAYQRSLDLCATADASGRSKCLGQIGMAHYGRFREARKSREPANTLLLHAQAAERYYLEALRLSPDGAPGAFAPLHNALGTLYAELGQFNPAREHFQKAAQNLEQAGDRLRAGQTRFNIAVMYAQAAERENQPSQQRANFVRARAYAEAALRDFQHYEGRAAALEAQAQGLLARIDQALAKLPQ